MSDYTQSSWATAVLTDLGDTPNSNNIADLELWEASEGGAGPEWGTNNKASYNPLNTTETEPGSISINSDDVQAFTNWDQGLAATVQTLQQNQKGYSQIEGALQQGLPPGEFAPIVQNSAWGTKNIDKIAQEDGYVLNSEFVNNMAYNNEPVTPGVNLSTADPEAQSDEALLISAGGQLTGSPYSNATASSSANQPISYTIAQDLQNIMNPTLGSDLNPNTWFDLIGSTLVRGAIIIVGIGIMLAGVVLIIYPTLKEQTPVVGKNAIVSVLAK